MPGKPNIVCGFPLESSAVANGECSLQVQDLAKHFADGRLSAEKMWAATDEELHESLIAVRGVGPVCITFGLSRQF